MDRPKHIRVIVNPGARSGRARKTRDRAGRVDGVRLEWVESTGPEHLRQLVAAAQEGDVDALALAGGDGTLALALGALGGPNRVPLALLPAGSGNDFARHLGVPRKLSGALAVFRDGVSRWVDVASAGSLGRFCCVASLGLDARALRTIHGPWFPRSRALEVTTALHTVCTYRPRPVRIAWEGGSFEGEVMFAAVTNTRSCGGGLRVSPGARLDDGRLDLCIVRRTGRARLLRHFPRIVRGAHAHLPEVVLATSPWFRVEGLDGPLPVALDGEPPRARRLIELRCEPAALQVLAPPVAAPRPDFVCTV